MTDAERIAQPPRTLTEAQERQARVMLIGGRNGDRILKELDAERAAFAQLQADYNSSQQTVRELEQVVKHCNPAEGDGELCYYCGKPTSDVAANPGMWSIALCHADDLGVVKWHHTSCVTDRICERDALQQTVRELREHLTLLISALDIARVRCTIAENRHITRTIDAARAVTKTKSV